MDTLDLRPPELHLLLYANDDEVIELVVSNDGIAEDLSGYTSWLCEVKEDKHDVTPAFSATVDATDAANGIVELTFASTDTSSLISSPATQWEGYWDVQASAPTSGNKETFVGGPITITLDVSR